MQSKAFLIGYEYQEYQECPYWPPANKYAPLVQCPMEKDIVKVRKAGLFSHPSFKSFGAFPKKYWPNKYRIIHDLSNDNSK